MTVSEPWAGFLPWKQSYHLFKIYFNCYMQRDRSRVIFALDGHCKNALKFSFRPTGNMWDLLCDSLSPSQAQIVFQPTFSPSSQNYFYTFHVLFRRAKYFSCLRVGNWKCFCPFIIAKNNRIFNVGSFYPFTKTLPNA